MSDKKETGGFIEIHPPGCGHERPDEREPQTEDARSKPVTNAYRAGYDRIFTERKGEVGQA